MNGEFIRDKIIIFFASGFYVGKLPIAPGTWGSLLAIPLFWPLSLLPFFSQVLTLVFLFGISVWLSSEASKILVKNDPSMVVIDEIMGMFTALTGAAFSGFYILWAFIFFRIFDIFKPFPIRWLEKKFSGGLGIILDDIVAGIFANLSWRLIEYGINYAK